MKNLDTLINEQKKKHKEFEYFDEEYLQFKLNLLSEKLKEIRKEAGLTQDELAQRINSKKQYISKLENNPLNMTMATLIKVSKALGKEVNVDIV